MLDATIVRAHQQAATGRKKGAKTRLWAFPRWTEYQDPPAGQRLGGTGRLPSYCRQASEFPEALPLLAGRTAEVVMADRGYDSTAIVQAIQAHGRYRSDPF